MGERRKRKSLWDMGEQTNHFSGMSEHDSHHSSHDSGRYHEFSASGTYTAQKSRDRSGRPSWESLEENLVAPMNDSSIRSRQNAPEGKEIVGGNRDYQNMSPGLDGMERRKYDRTHEDDRSHSHRYLGRSRSRSRSRSRTRGRSRSRSLSRGRGKERGRARSRSRSRSGGGTRGERRSRSPIGDYRRQSYGWSDRRNVPDKSSQICRDFAAGRCRRGSQCRFFHPKNVSRGDGDLLGDDTVESQRNKEDHGQISKHSYGRGPGADLMGDVSDLYHEQFLNKSGSAVPCKDFMKGKCRWGDTCRFSHHFASDEDFGKGSRYISSDKDIELQSHKNGKPLCKYFAAGKCDRDNCRFSHEDPKFISLEGRSGEVSHDQSLHNKGKPWNGLTWNDATRISDNLKPGGWSEAIITVTDNAGDTTNAKNDNPWNHHLENENKSWEMPERTDHSINRNRQPSPPGGSVNYGGGIGTAESIGKENMANKQEHLMLHMQNEDGNLNIQGQNTLHEERSFSVKAWQQNVSPVSHIQQQHHGVAEKNLVTSFRSDVLDEVKDSRNSTHPILFSGQTLNQNGENLFAGHSSISNKTDGGQNMLCPNLSTGFIGNLNGPEAHLVAPLSLQAQMHDQEKAVQMTGTLEAKGPHFFPNLLTREHSAQLINSPVAIAGQHVAPITVPTVFPTQRLVNEQSPKTVDVEGSNSRGMMSSFSDTNVQSNPVRVFHDPIIALGNGRGTNEHGSHAEQNNQIQVGQSSQSSIVVAEPENSKVGRSESPKLKQETVLANSEVNEGNRAIVEESKGVQKHSENLDSHGKVEENSANKDDKGMRIFKNSLIEFVKDILKPTWKEGKMSREVHKTIVKKVVDKVTSTIKVDHIPKTQDKVEQYLSYSKPKIAKLVQAYVGRCLKTDA